MTPAEQGFKDRLTEHDLNVTYTHFDAERDEDRLAGYIRENRKAISEQDLVYTFGTTATRTVMNLGTDGVPHIFNIVSDPIAANLTLSLTAPTKGISGAKLALSPKVILQLLEHILPFKTIAIVFDPREQNAQTEAANLTLAAQALGKTPKRLRFAPDARRIEPLFEHLGSEIEAADVVFFTASSSYVAHADLLEQLIPKQVVSVGTSPAYIERGVTLAYGAEYRQRGQAAADIAAQILLESKDPEEIPIDEISAHEAVLFVRKNSPAVKKLNLENSSNRIEYK